MSQERAKAAPPLEFADRREALFTCLRAGADLAVAFSGGVDSSVLLHAASAVLGDRAVGVLADSPSLPRAELEEARALAGSIGVELVVLRTQELERPGYASNDGLRCYWCKRTLFEDMRAWAQEAGVARLAFGEIVDDALDDRPGRRAAAELEIVAPLAAAGFTKSDVRRYAREAGLPVHDKPASACLASRIPRGTPVTRAALARVEEAEARVRALGFRVLRVRDHGSHARLEVGPSELERAREMLPSLSLALDSLAFERLELAAYRSPTEELQP